MDNLLGMIGLALRAGRLEVGDEAVGDACRLKHCRLLLAASDAGEGAQRRAAHFAQEGQCLLAELPCSKEELGAALGRKSCALAAVTDLGLAQAIAAKLAQRDPAQYGETVQRLERKAQRATQRKEKSSGESRQRKRTAPAPVQYNRKYKKK